MLTDQGGRGTRRVRDVLNSSFSVVAVSRATTGKVRVVRSKRAFRRGTLVGTHTITGTAGLPAVTSSDKVYVSTLGNTPKIRATHFTKSGTASSRGVSGLLGDLRGIPRGREKTCFTYYVTIIFPDNRRGVFFNGYRNEVLGRHRNRGNFNCSPMFFIPRCGYSVTRLPTGAGGSVDREDHTLSTVIGKLGWLGQVLDRVHHTVSSCGVVGGKSGVTMNVSNNGSDLTLLTTLSTCGGFTSGSFSLVTVAVSVNFRNVSFSPVRNFYRDLRIPCVIGGARVNRILFSVHGRDGPYSLYTGVHENTLYRLTGRRKYGGITLKRRGRSMVRAFFLSLFCRKQLGDFTPIACLSQISVEIVHPLVCIPRKSVGNCTDHATLPIIGGLYPVSKRSGQRSVGSFVGRGGGRSRRFGAHVVRTVGAKVRS